MSRQPLHIMVDLETMGNGPTAAIVSIGALVFDPKSDFIDRHEFSVDVDLESSVEAGLTMDVSTVKFWLEQAISVTPVWIAETTTLQDALRDFRRWIGIFLAPGTPTYEGIRIWGHGATFDPVVLASAYRAVGQEPPFTYREPRDTRTVFELAGLDMATFPCFGTQHNALDDARNQARAVQESYRRLGLASPAGEAP